MEAWKRRDLLAITEKLSLEKYAKIDVVDIDHKTKTLKPKKLLMLDPSQKIIYFNDFLGDLLSDELQIDLGTGTGNAVALSPGAGGRVSLASASDDGAHAANFSAIALGALDWRADQGGLAIEAQIQIDDISEAYCFIGFTDTLPGTTLEAPIFLNGAAVDSDAANACGALYDVDGTTEQWCHAGVKANTDTDPRYAGAAPVQDTYEIIRVEVSEEGTVQAFLNGVPFGAPIGSAVTVTTPLCPVIIIGNRSANQVTALVDYILVEANR